MAVQEQGGWEALCDCLGSTSDLTSGTPSMCVLEGGCLVKAHLAAR